MSCPTCRTLLNAAYQEADRKKSATKSTGQDGAGTLRVNSDIGREASEDGWDRESRLDAEALDRSWSPGATGKDAEESGAASDWKRERKASDSFTDSREEELTEEPSSGKQGARSAERNGAGNRPPARSRGIKSDSTRGQVKEYLRSVDPGARKWSGRGEFVGWGGLWGLGVGAGGGGQIHAESSLPFMAMARTTSSVTRSLELVRPPFAPPVRAESPFIPLMSCAHLHCQRGSVCVLTWWCFVAWRRFAGIMLPPARPRSWQAHGKAFGLTACGGLVDRQTRQIHVHGGAPPPPPPTSDGVRRARSGKGGPRREVDP